MNIFACSMELMNLRSGGGGFEHCSRAWKFGMLWGDSLSVGLIGVG